MQPTSNIRKLHLHSNLNSHYFLPFRAMQHKQVQPQNPQIPKLLPKHLQTKRSVLAVGIDCCVLVNTCVRGVAFTSAST